MKNSLRYYFDTPCLIFLAVCAIYAIGLYTNSSSNSTSSNEKVVEATINKSNVGKEKVVEAIVNKSGVENPKMIEDSEENNILTETFKILGYNNSNFAVKSLPNKYSDMSDLIAWTYNPDFYNVNPMQFLLEYFENELNDKKTISSVYKEFEPLENNRSRFNYYALLANGDTNKPFAVAMTTVLDASPDKICKKDISESIVENLKNNGFTVIRTKNGNSNSRKIYLRRENEMIRYAVIKIMPTYLFSETEPYGYGFNLALSNIELD